MDSGWASGVREERSDWSGGRVFWRQTQGVESEQKPHPPEGMPSLVAVGESVPVNDEGAVKAEVKSISMG